MATRKEQREQARAEREAREAAERAKAQRQKRMLQLGGALVAVAAIVVAVVLIAGSGGSSSSGKGGSPKSDANPGTNQTTQLLGGIPQAGPILGKPDAPVTVTEFADLQCPFCRDYTLHQFPGIVAQYVKSGKVKMVFKNYAFIGPDSLTAARAAEAAGKQNKLWNFIDVFYNNQQTENTDYVTDAFLTKIANGAGVDATKMLADRQDPAVDTAIAKAQQDAKQAGVNSTPTFIVQKAGQAGKKASAQTIEAALAAATAGT